MYRLMLSLILLVFPGIILAQPTPEPRDGKLVIPLNLTPAGVQKPLSRYYLTPQYVEMQPGNRVQTFMRAFMEQNAFFSSENRAKREPWLKMKLEDLPLEEMKKSGVIAGLAYRDLNDVNKLSRGRPLGDVDLGARQLSSDWQLWFDIREDGINTLLPEIQGIRELATILKIRMRYEIRTGDTERATYSARTFHGLASSLETHPTFIAQLVSIAIHNIHVEILEEWIQQSHCPNLYWSFTEIPDPRRNLRLAAQGERLLSYTMFGSLMQVREPLSDSEMQKRLSQIDQFIEQTNRFASMKFPKYSTSAVERAKDPKAVQLASKILTDTGFKDDVVRKFRPLQTIVLGDLREYEVFLDDLLALQVLPFPEILKREPALAKRIKDSKSFMAEWLMPVNFKIAAAGVRVQQRLAYLRIIEGIRLYAHEHDGKLPATLGDLSVPVPLDPVSEQPFEYSVNGEVATLHGKPPEPAPVTNRYYEIRIKK